EMHGAEIDAGADTKDESTVELVIVTCVQPAAVTSRVIRDIQTGTGKAGDWSQNSVILRLRPRISAAKPEMQTGPVDGMIFRNAGRQDSAEQFGYLLREQRAFAKLHRSAAKDTPTRRGILRHGRHV